MFESMLSQPRNLFGHFERARRALDDVFDASGLPNSIGSVVLGTLPAIKCGLKSASLEVNVQPPTPGCLGAVHADVRVPRCRRSFTLTLEFDAARNDANRKEGVLTPHMPRQAHAQPRRIEVTSGRSCLAPDPGLTPS